MAKSKVDYFELFENQAKFGLTAVEYLQKALSSYSKGSIRSDLENIHAIEHQADEVNHKVREALRIDFVTPIERDDIAELSQGLDDIVDAVEDVLMVLYMFHVEETTEEMDFMLSELHRSAECTLEAMRKLPTFRKASEEILPLLYKVNDAESECDRLYLEAMHKLHDPEGPCTVQQRIAYTKVYEAIEDAMDAMELCASRTEEIIMTNI